MVDQTDIPPASGFSLLRCFTAGKGACLFVAAMAWRARYRSLRLAGSVCILTAGVATLLVIAGGYFVMRLSHSPMVIEGLGPRIAAALDEKFGHGYHFALGQTVITSHGYGPTLGIDGLSLKGAEGQTIFFAPHAEVSIDPFALIIGRVTPKRLEVQNVEIKLSVLPSGALTVSAAADSPSLVVPLPVRHPESDSIQELAQGPAQAPATVAVPAKIPRAIIIKQAAAAMRLVIDTLTNPDSAIAAVDHVGIKSGRLEIDDKTTEETTVFNNLDVAFDKSGGVTDFNLSAEGPNGRWTSSVEASGAPGTPRHLNIAFNNLSLDEISLASGVRNLGVDFDMPVSTRFDVVLTPEGSVSQATGQFNMGSGYFRVDDPDDEPLLIDALGGHFHWDSSTRRIVLDDARMKSGGSQFGIKGDVTPPVMEGDAFAADFQLAEPGIYGAERPGEEPITIKEGELALRFLPKDKQIVIDRFNFSGADFGLSMTGDIDWVNGPHVKFQGTTASAPVRVVERLWPSMIAAPVRSWLLAHFKGGTVDSGKLRVDLNEAALAAMRADHPPPDDASSVDLSLSNGSLNFLPGVPPLHDLSGVAHITGKTTNFSITGGVLDTDSGHRLTVSDGSFRVPDAGIKPTPAIIVAKVTGSLEAVRDLLSYDAFKSYASMPVDSNVRGQIDGRLEVDMKIAQPGAKNPDPLILINSAATNVVIEKLIGKEKLENATMNVVVDASGLKGSGQGHIFGVPATLEFTRPMGAKTAEAILSFTTDDASRAKQGFGPIPGVNGPVGTRVSAAMGSTDKQKAQIELDLSKTVLDGVVPGVSKPAGSPGKASFSITAADDGAMQIDQISVDAGPIQVRGSADLGPDLSLVSAKFSQVRLSPGDDVKIDITKPGDTLKMMVRATTLDARPFLKSLSIASGSSAAAANAKEPPAFKNIDLDVKCGLLTGNNKKTISNFDLRFVKQNDLLRQFALSGHFGRENVSGTMATGSQQLTISTQDAGSLLSFVDLYRHMESGDLNANLLLGSNETLTGALEIKDFMLRDEPAMRRLVAAGAEQIAPGQDPSRLTRIDTDAVPFKTLEVRFQRSGSHLELRDGIINGNEIGLTVSGSLDFGHDQVALNGTFVPAYELNNLFSKIPVFGIILGGGTNEGLFAVDYHISGSATNPKLNINALTAIAPGILRKIFGSLDPANANAQQQPWQSER